MSIAPSRGAYSARCTTLWGLIYNAYEVRSTFDYPPGLPAWADKDKFDVEAKMDNDTVAEVQKLSPRERTQAVREMLKSLLADRFHLQVHHEIKVLAVYELIVAKGGFKLKPLPPDQKSGGESFGLSMFKMHNQSIADFAHVLSQSRLTGRDVLDKTGITGNYDIDLKWTPDSQQGTADAGPTLFTALKEQLGLKLVPAKGPVDTLVIDHAERPSEN